MPSNSFVSLSDHADVVFIFLVVETPCLKTDLKERKHFLKKKASTMTTPFEAAVEYVRSLPKDGPLVLSNSVKLEFYSLYKQATEGDVKGTQPWAVQLEARAKWDAWNGRKGMSNDDAKAAYVTKIEQIKAENAAVAAQ